MIFFLNVAIWGVAVYSLKIAFFGRPVLSLLDTSPKPLLEQVAVALDPDGPESEWGDDVNEFLKKLARFSLFSTGVLAVEYILCIYFLSISYVDWVAWFLVVKNLVFLYLSIHFQRNSNESNPIYALLAIPAWAIRWERIGCLAGALCLVVEMIKLNGYL